MATSWHFGPFTLDIDNAYLWRDRQRIDLRPKTFAVLAYLVRHAGKLVTKTELLEAVWPGTAVGDGVLKISLVELRKAFGETAKHPQFIETVPRRGYRFIAPATQHAPYELRPEERDTSRLSTTIIPPDKPILSSTAIMVGREPELGQLHQWYHQAMMGQRQLVFISGEAGIGKTTLMDAFIDLISTGEGTWVAWGQCIEQYGEGEAYLPLLECLGQLGRAPQGTQLIDLLKQLAPSWLLQLPALFSDDEVDQLQKRSSPTTRERMLRELAEVIEAFTTDHPLILVLEDLHWSDLSTLDWLGYMARRRQTTQLLILVTYRPVDAAILQHPVRRVTQDLLAHGQCRQLVLDYLSEADVAVVLTRRYPGLTLPKGFARRLYQRTHGNPLFLITLLDDMIQRDAYRQQMGNKSSPQSVEELVDGMPEDLRRVIEQQLERCTPQEQAVLEAASVAGVEFSAAVVAPSAAGSLDEIEARCSTLAQRGQFLQTRGRAVWPDGTIATRFGFIHALYHEVLYNGLSAGRRVRLHRQIGIRLETAYGMQSHEIATELATHFERGQDIWKAIQYRRQAADNALQRSAHHETITHINRGLQLLVPLPVTPDHRQQELALLTTLGVPLVATKGYTAPEVEQTYNRAYTLCQQVGDHQQMGLALVGLWRVYSMRGKLKTAREIAAQLLELARRGNDASQLIEAHRSMGVILCWLGNLTEACTHLEQGAALYDHQTHAHHAYQSGLDIGVSCLSMAAVPLWMLGYPDRAVMQSEQAITLAQQLKHPFSLAFALINAARLYHFRREWRAVRARAEAVQALATEHDFALWQAVATRWRGVALAAQGQVEEGIALIHQGQAAYQATGTATGESYYRLLLAEAYCHAGQIERGLDVMHEALATFASAEDRLYEAEVYRLKGKLLLTRQSPPLSEVETCFRQALAVSRRQKAKSLELRAAMSLAQLRPQPENDVALSDVYHGFTEGFDTADLEEAKARLEARRI